MADRAIYFREGPGFIFVKFLGQGITGAASLVWCVKDGKYYVRKEDLRPINLRLMGPTEEVRNALSVDHLRHVPKLKGWVTYRNSLGQSFGVSYQEYYTAGTLAKVIDRSQSSRIAIPEIWIYDWVKHMIATITSLHQSGLAHTDAHLNNWFLSDHNTPRDVGCWVPSIALGDFDRVTRRDAGGDWLQHCRKDFDRVVGNFAALLEFSSDRKRARLIHGILTDTVRRATSVKELHQMMAIMQDKAKSLIANRELPLSFKVQRQLVEDSRPILRAGRTVFWEFETRDLRNNPGIAQLKTFRLAKISHSGKIMADWRPHHLMHSDWYIAVQGRWKL